MKINHRHFLVALIIIVLGTSGCTPVSSPTPESTAQELLNTTPSQPTITATTILKPEDVPIYKTSFEGTPDEALKGFSGVAAEVSLNTKNVDVQSGSQSIEISGILAGPIYSRIQLSLSVETITGEPSLDLTNKTIGFSYFLPESSPIGAINIACQSGKKAIELVSVKYDDQPFRDFKGFWHYEQFDIRLIAENSTWAWSDYSPEESRQIIQNCTEILISAIRPTEGSDENAVFYVDNIRWISTDILNSVPLDDEEINLRNYADARGVKVSTVLWHTSGVWDNFKDPWYLYTLAKQFNTTTVGVGDPPKEKPADISRIEFDYSLADEVVDFAEGNGLMLEGGTGFWHTNNPLWITDGTYDELKAWMDRKLESDISHYKGKVLYWGVFNEILDWDGTNVGLHNRQKKDPNDVLYGTEWAPYGGRYSPYVDGNDTSLIDYAFIKAKSVDPEAMYYLNEGVADVEMIGTPASEYLFDFVIGMKERGVPIDGIGLQIHLGYPVVPPGDSNSGKLQDIQGYLLKVEQNIKRYADAGLFVAITEFECQIRLDDLDLTTDAGKEEYARRQKAQADIYAGMLKIAMDNPNVAFIRFWTISDQPFTSAFDWRGMGEGGNAVHPFVFTDSFLFDKNYDPKTAYDAVMEVLKP